MKKFFVLVLCVIITFAILGLSGCSSPEPGETPPPDNAAPVELKIAHIYAPEHTQHLSLLKFKEEVEKASNGSITVEIYPSGSLGSEREIVEQIQLGTIDMGTSGGGMWAAFTPAAGVFELPFLYKSVEHQTRVMHEVGLKAAQEMLVPANFRPLFYFTTSIRGSIMKTKPIYTAADFKGVKMRVPENPVFVETFAAVGANPTTTPWSEAYTSIASGVVDGAEVNPETLVSANLHEVTNYFSRTNHIAPVHLVTINETKWQSLTAEQQKIILDAGAATEAWQLAKAAENEDVAIAAMEAAGVEINDMDAGEREKLIEMVQPLYEKYGQEYGVVDLINAILAVE